MAGEVPSTRVHEDDRTVAFMDINPATRGHLLVVPREHAADVHAIDPEDLKARRASPPRRSRRPRARQARRRRREPPQLVRLRAWQTVFHFHLHVIPRYENDPLRLPWQPAARRRDEIAAAAEGPRRAT